MNLKLASLPRMAWLCMMLALALPGLGAQNPGSDDETGDQAASQDSSAWRPGEFMAALRSLNLSSDELDRIGAVVLDSLKIIQPANAEIEIVKAEVTQALLKPRVALKDLDPLVRDSTEQTYRIRMAQLDRQRLIDAINNSNSRVLNLLRSMNAR
jgi:hypothetical protein